MRKWLIFSLFVISLLFLIGGNQINVPSGGSVADTYEFLTTGDSIVNSSAGEFTFTRDENGTVVITAADAATPTGLTVQAQGTGTALLGGNNGPVGIGSNGVTDNVTISSDDTGIAEFTGIENGFGADDIAVMQDDIILCGQLIDAGDVETFFGPAALHYLGTTATSVTLGDTTVCDTLDSETESSADAAIAADFPAFKVSGFWCRVSAQPTNNIVLTARTAEGDILTTDGSATAIQCTIAGGAATSCSATAGSTTDVAAGATIAIQAEYTEDLDTTDIWCKMYFAIK